MQSSQSRAMGTDQAQTVDDDLAEGLTNIVSMGPRVPLKDLMESKASNSIVQVPPVAGFRKGLEPSEQTTDETLDLGEGGTDAEPHYSAAEGEIRVVAAGATVPHILKVRWHTAGLIELVMI